MTSTPVTEVSAFYINAAKNNASSGSAEALTTSFSQVFGKASGQDYKDTTNAESQVTTAKVQNSDKTLKSDSKEPTVDQTDSKTDTSLETKDNKVVDNDTTEATDPADVVEKMEELAGTMIKELAKQLNVSEEEITAALQNLGMTAMDLLNPETLTQVVVSLTEGADMLSLVTDETLFADVKELTTTLQTLEMQAAEELNLSPGELKQIMKQVQNMQQPSDKAVLVPEKPMQSTATESTSEVIVNTSTGADPEEAKVTVILKSDSTLPEEKTSNVKNTTMEEVPTEKKTEVSETETSQQEGQNSKQEGQTGKENMLFQNVMTQLTEAVSKTEAKQPFSETVDTQNIMKQISDFVKVQVKADTTEMEMQLHPATLGTINIHVASKGGVITAQFTAQNEAVKAVLESQIVQLRENLNDQGVKIEAVEVTVQSHAFEQNLSQNNNTAEEQNGEKKKSTRQINLNDNGMTLEELTDEKDRMAVKIMSDNGNTVDYTA